MAPTPHTHPLQLPQGLGFLDMAFSAIERHEREMQRIAAQNQPVELVQEVEQLRSELAKLQGVAQEVRTLSMAVDGLQFETKVAGYELQGLTAKVVAMERLQAPSTSRKEGAEAYLKEGREEGKGKSGLVMGIWP